MMEELQKLCHGETVANGSLPMQILLPPSCAVALITYGHVMDVRCVFHELAYKKFKHVPLYLEWAPLAAMVDPALLQAKDKSGGQEVEKDGTTVTDKVRRDINDVKVKDNNDKEHNTTTSMTNNEPSSTIQQTP
eukprot:11026926-Ditylum_brightwellii.AAC.1